MRLWLMSLVLLALVTGCGGSPTPSPDAPGGSKSEGKLEIKPGGIYSCKSGDGDFSVVKVLVVGDGAVHARLHKNQYKEPDCYRHEGVAGRYRSRSTVGGRIPELGAQAAAGAAGYGGRVGWVSALEGAVAVGPGDARQVSRGIRSLR